MRLFDRIFGKKNVHVNGDFVSHIGQDMWVSEVFGNKKCGYFLDFGAFDGILTSNTYFLEKRLRWNGICVEPNPVYYPMLCRNRECITVNVALWPESRKSLDFIDAHGLSCFPKYIDHDCWGKTRHDMAKPIKVDTINPTELLDRFSVPKTIDYLSLDVEGAEIEVLTSLDLNSYKIALMTIEHSNNEKKRSELIDHLSYLGYSHINLSYDICFFHNEILKNMGIVCDPAEIADRVRIQYKVI